VSFANKLEFVVSTKIVDAKIIQAVVSPNMIDGVHDTIRTLVINTEEKQLREALIALGWTPPADKEKCPFCGLLTETPCDSPPPTICDTLNEAMLREQATSAAKPACEPAPVATAPNPQAPGR
jgi:hypothetical protein